MAAVVITADNIIVSPDGAIAANTKVNIDMMKANIILLTSVIL